MSTRPVGGEKSTGFAAALPRRGRTAAVALLLSSWLSAYAMPCSVPEREALATKERWHAGVVQRRSLVARTDKCQARPIARHVAGPNKILILFTQYRSRLCPFSRKVHLVL